MKSARLGVAEKQDNPTITTLRDKVAELDRDIAEGRAKVGVSGINEGLRMILIATVICVAISWIATIALQYTKLQMVRELADQDALRVMCAVDPPMEQDFQRLHLCEIVAKGGEPEVSSELISEP